MEQLLNVYSYAKQYRKSMYSSILLLSASVILAIVPYYLVYHMIMRFTGEGSLSIAYLAVMSGLVFVSLALRTQTHHMGLSASHRLAYDTLMGMRKRTADKLRMMPMGTIGKHGTGSLKKNFVENIEDMEIILAHAVPEGISNLLTVVIVTGALFALDWRMALLSLAVLPIGLIAVGFMIRDGMQRMGPYYQASKEMNETIIEYISGMEVIKVFNQTASSFQKYRASVDNYKKYTLDWYKVSWTYLTVYSIVLPSTLLFVLPFGTLFYTNGSLTLGTFVLSILLAMSLGVPLMRLVEFLPVFPQLKQKAQKIEELFAEQELASGARSAVPESCSVSFRHVSFAYKDGVDVLHDISFTARPNTVTALVGESGSGKSTLAKLLVRFWDVREGAIEIGGVDIREYSFEALMNAISYVSQDIFLFNTTIMENIRIGNPDATDAEIIGIAKLAQCHDFIMAAEHGYQTTVGGSGDKLSGGQKQRIAIARAMLKNAPIVVLDEATSAADPENEDRIQAALNSLIQGKTLIVIAHRLSTIVDADQILVMRKGLIEARGTHGELLQQSPTYHTMWTAHREAMNWDIAVLERSN